MLKITFYSRRERLPKQIYWGWEINHNPTCFMIDNKVVAMLDFSKPYGFYHLTDQPASDERWLAFTVEYMEKDEL